MQSGMEQQVWGPLIPTLLLRQGQPIIRSPDDVVGSVSDIPGAEVTVLDTYGVGAPTGNGPSFRLGTTSARSPTFPWNYMIGLAGRRPLADW